MAHQYVWQLFREDADKIEALTKVRAYFIWEERVKTGKNGSPFDDWLQAKQYVKETFPWLVDKTVSGAVETHRVRRNEEFPDILICPNHTCGESLGKHGGVIEIGIHRCSCCGIIIDIIRGSKVVL